MRLLSYVAVAMGSRRWSLHVVHVIVSYAGDSGMQNVKCAGEIADIAENAPFRPKRLQVLQVRVRICGHTPDLAAVFVGIQQLTVVETCNCAGLGSGGSGVQQIRANLQLSRVERRCGIDLAPTACASAGFPSYLPKFLAKICRIACFGDGRGRAMCKCMQSNAFKRRSQLLQTPHAPFACPTINCGNTPARRGTANPRRKYRARCRS
jgi:hypothetical protein